ncbi:MAG: cache domain-containing protein, partial [Desulfurivibrionaceae bacterium]
MANAIQSDLNSSYHLFYGELYKEAAMLNLMAEQLAENREVRGAFLDKERERLHKVVRPFFQNFRADYDVTHLYFHTLERNTFLRVHFPEMHGDPIDRFTLKEAEATGSVSYGLELGPMGTLTLRVVMPWRVDGRIIGYLELGKEIDQVLAEMKKILEVDFILIVNKDHLNKDSWGKGKHGLPVEGGDWNQFPDFVVF